MDIDCFCLADWNDWNDMKNLRITMLHVLVCVHKVNPPCFDSLPCATEWIAETKSANNLIFWVAFLPNIFLSFVNRKRMFMMTSQSNRKLQSDETSDYFKQHVPQRLKHTCIHTNSYYISDTRSISFLTICHDDIGKWLVLMGPWKGWCPATTKFICWLEYRTFHDYN